MAEGQVTLVFQQRGAQTVQQQVQAVSATLKGTAAATRDTALAGDMLVDRFNKLRQGADLGRMSKAQYAQQLRTTLADLRAFSAQTQLNSRDTAYFAQQSRLMQGELNRVGASTLRTQNALSRTALGVQTFTTAFAGGRLSVTGLASALGTLSIGSPVIGGIVAAFSVVAAAASLMRKNTDSAAEAVIDFQHLQVRRSLTPEQQAMGAVAGLHSAREELLRLEGPPVAPGQDATAQRRRLTDAERERAHALRAEVIPALQAIVGYNANSLRILERERREREALRALTRDILNTERLRNQASREWMEQHLRGFGQDRSLADTLAGRGAGAAAAVRAFELQEGRQRAAEEAARERRSVETRERERRAEIAGLVEGVVDPVMLAEVDRQAEESLDRWMDGLRLLREEANRTRQAMGEAFAEMAAGMFAGGNLAQLAARIFLQALAKQLRIEALAEYARAAAALAIPGGQAKAAQHARAGHLFMLASGAATGAAAAIGSGGGGGGGAGAFRSGASAEGGAGRGEIIVEVPGDSLFFGGRGNPALLDWFVGLLEQVGQRRVVVRAV